jgi:hypothetical protein
VSHSSLLSDIYSGKEHVERKVPKYEYHNKRERKGKTLAKIEEISRGKAHGNLFIIFQWSQTSF